MDFNIKKGYDMGLEGQPAPAIAEISVPATVAVYPLEFDGIKQRLKVAEGQAVTRGSELMEDKARVAFKLCSPAAGTVRSVVRGARRFVEKIIIEVDPHGPVETFGRFSSAQIGSLDRAVILEQLLATGYLALIRQRPFSHMADVATTPKSIFVNAMHTAPFHADAETVAVDDPAAFQAGLDLLTRLTKGPVHLCVGPEAGTALRTARNVQVHTFRGPHPAGNSSVHISRIDPLGAHDVIWTVRAVDLVLIGRLFLDGVLPASRVIALGGPGVQPDACRHYRVAIGAELAPLLAAALKEGPQRVINGDALTGTAVEEHPHLRFRQSAATVIPRDRERRFLGWTMPGFDRKSFSRVVASSWLPLQRKWALGTNLNGEKRAIVLTGHYDKVMPMNILVDFLVKACLAGDTDEAIALGILETDPEDFALCEFICPSKLELQQIIRDGLKQIEEEGV